eukprot:1161645-Pelagomonas_calceolata.AAC.1
MQFPQDRKDMKLLSLIPLCMLIQPTYERNITSLLPALTRPWAFLPPPFVQVSAQTKVRTPWPTHLSGHDRPVAVDEQVDGLYSIQEHLLGTAWVHTAPGVR